MKKLKMYLTIISVSKKLKLLSVVLMMYAIPLGVSAQNADACKNFINTSSSAVYDAQKAMLASHKTNVDGKLATLVVLQMNAVVLYNKEEYALAAYYSSLARKNAVELLVSLNGDANKIYDVSDEEKKLFENAPLVTEPNLQARKNFSTPSERDEDYIKSDALGRSKIQIQ